MGIFPERWALYMVATSIFSVPESWPSTGSSQPGYVNSVLLNMAIEIVIVFHGFTLVYYGFIWFASFETWTPSSFEPHGWKPLVLKYHSWGATLWLFVTVCS